MQDRARYPGPHGRRPYVGAERTLSGAPGGGLVTTMEINTNALRWALTATLKAASKDATGRPAICGIRIERPTADEAAPIAIRAGMLRLVGTDGHRLHVADIAATGDLALPPEGVTLDRAGSERLLKALPKGTKKQDPPPAEIVLAGREMTAKVDGSVLPLPLLTERYPDWRQVIPKAAEKIAARVGFNPQYLADACAVAPSDCVTLHMPEDLAPMMVTSTSPDVGAFAAIVMPMRI